MTTIGDIVTSKNGGKVELPPEPPSIAELLRAGGVAVIVGGRSTNFTEDMRRHAQLVFWDSTDPKTIDKTLPSNCRAVLITRWVSHQQDNRIRKQARERGVFVVRGLATSGDVRDHLQPVVDHVIPKTKPTPKTAIEALFDKPKTDQPVLPPPPR